MMTLRNTLMASALILPLAAPSAWAETPDDVLVVAQNIDDIVAIDPAQAYEFTSGELVTNIYDRLVQYDAEDPTVLAPGLAAEWTADETAKTITFTLRDGVTFHSGNPVRAEDVVGSFARVVKLNLTPAFILTQLGWTPENVEQMVTAEGNTVTVRYEGDFSPTFVLNVLASRPASIVDMVTVMENEVDGDMGNAWLNANSAGSGPFSLQTFRAAELVRLQANPDYFKGAPGIEGVILQHVAESATQQLLLEQGDVDMAKNLTPDQIATLDPQAIRVETFPQAAVHFLSFNQKVEALTNPAVWEAARYLVDYEGMTNSFLAGQMEIHQAFWPKGFPGSLDETPFSYDPERARTREWRRPSTSRSTSSTPRPSQTWRSRSRRASPRPGSTSRSSRAPGLRSSPSIATGATRPCCSTGARTSWTRTPTPRPSPTTPTTQTRPTRPRRRGGTPGRCRTS
jgi:peptide/nickel transport system substrate-binding protein